MEKERLVNLNPIRLPMPGVKGEYPQFQSGDMLCVFATPYPGKHITLGGYHVQVTRQGNWKGSIYAVPIGTWRYATTKNGYGEGHECALPLVGWVGCDCDFCEFARSQQ